MPDVRVELNEPGTRYSKYIKILYHINRRSIIVQKHTIETFLLVFLDSIDISVANF